MLTIYKYPIEVTTKQQVNMPDRASIHHAAVQNDKLYIWAIVEKENKIVPRTIYVYGTGHEFENWPEDFIGTVHFMGLVLHVFNDREIK